VRVRKERRGKKIPHKLPKPKSILLPRQQPLQPLGRQHPDDPRVDGEREQHGELLLGDLDVVVDVGVLPHKTEGLPVGEVRDDVEREVLGLAAEVEDLVPVDVPRPDQVLHQGQDVLVDAGLDAVDLLARVAGRHLGAELDVLVRGARHDVILVRVEAERVVPFPPHVGRAGAVDAADEVRVARDEVVGADLGDWAWF